MMSPSRPLRYLSLSAAVVMVLWFSTAIRSEEAEQLLQRFDDYPHAELVGSARSQVIDYELGLGAMRKSRGAWQLKKSERLSGELITYTWQIVDGFTSREVAEELSGALAGEGQPVELLFSCEGRSCGPGVQWANRVFRQRILYGREELQRYRIYALGEAGADRLIIYDSARTADRQYLHVELLLSSLRDAEAAAGE